MCPPVRAKSVQVFNLLIQMRMVLIWTEQSVNWATDTLYSSVYLQHNPPSLDHSYCPLGPIVSEFDRVLFHSFFLFSLSSILLCKWYRTHHKWSIGNNNNVDDDDKPWSMCLRSSSMFTLCLLVLHFLLRSDTFFRDAIFRLLDFCTTCTSP